MTKHKKTKQYISNNLLDLLHFNILHINNSKFFAGTIMILLNIGSRLIPLQISESAEEYIKNSFSKPLLVFAIAWMGTRDIYTSVVLMIIIIALSEYLLNEHSSYCIVPSTHRVLNKQSMVNNNNNPNNKVNTEISNIIKLLEKIKNNNTL
jgi:hypothetical protein